MIENRICCYINGFLKWNICKKTIYIVGNKKFSGKICILNCKMLFKYTRKSFSSHPFTIGSVSPCYFLSLFVFLLVFFVFVFFFHLLFSLSLTLITSIFYCVHYTLLLLHLFITHLVIHFVITM